MEKLIEIKNLSKSFGNKKILDEVNLSLHQTENLVIMGKSGIGKSVLIKCIVRLIFPDSGTIRIFGEDMLESSIEQVNIIRKRIGFLFQNGALYDSLNVRENLEFPLSRSLKIKDKRRMRDMVMESLENVGLEDAIKKKPSELSGGMIKRLALARTLILEPEIILYDEPTTGLDPITSKEIIDLIVKIQNKAKASSIIITHDLKCAEATGNRIKILQDAKFIAEGEFDDLKQSSDKEIYAYFN